MTNDQQRVWISERCGWKKVERHTWLDGVRVPKEWTHITDLPNYLKDLNAMHEAETVMDSAQCVRYNDLLRNKYGPGTEMASHWHWHATAEQRADAFVVVFSTA